MTRVPFPMKPLSFAILTLWAIVTAAIAAPTVKLQVDWPSFLARQDLVWNRLPGDYFEGAYVGNGLLGAIVFRDDQAPNSLRFEIGRTDVYDHRQGGPNALSRTRLPIGQLLLAPVGQITAAHLRTDLWNAEIRGDLTTDAGTIRFRCFAADTENVLVIDLTTSAGEKGAKFSLRPQPATAPRFLMKPEDFKDGYTPNPPFQVTRQSAVEVCTQPLLAGSDYATAWREAADEGSHRTVFLTVANRLTATGSEADAVAAINQAVATGVPALEQAHRAWWHAYYPASFVSVPDARLESFYWIQLYKIASATREGRPVVDLMGPWFKPSVWNAYWHNLNTQLAYYAILTENHPAIGEPLCQLLENNVENLKRNVPPELQGRDCAALGTVVGNYGLVARAPTDERKDAVPHFIALPWLMQQFYLQYRYTMDEERLRERIYPLLRLTFNTYLHYLTLGSDGRYHLPTAFSDEYGNAEDTSMNLALLRWGLQTLIQTAVQLKIDDPLLPRWREVQDKLVDYPIDPATGIEIGKDTPFSKPHRHYSHLFAIFPLYLMNAEDQPELKPLMRQSIDHFIGLDGNNCMFKFTGASSLYAALGDGDEALRWLQRALEFQPKGPTVTPNTLYSENKWQTFESPQSASRDLLDMVIQSWGSAIRVFPACPSAWANVSFADLRTQGAFLVSAVRRDGHTQFIRIKSLAGAPCRLRSDLKSPISRLGSTRKLTAKDGVLTLNLAKGEEAILYSGDKAPDLTIMPVTTASDKDNAWGVR